MTAFVLVWPVGDLVYTHPWSWIPADDLTERSRHDNVRYDQWVERGYIETTPGNVTDWRFVTSRIKQLGQLFDIRRIGFDPAGARDTAADLEEHGFEIAQVGQGFRSLSAPSKRLEELVLSKRMVHCGNPVDRWCLDCTTIDTDAAGNIKPVKPKRHMTSKRIDITVARVMALDCLMRVEQETLTYSGLRTVG